MYDINLDDGSIYYRDFLDSANGDMGILIQRQLASLNFPSNHVQYQHELNYNNCRLFFVNLTQILFSDYTIPNECYKDIFNFIKNILFSGRLNGVASKITTEDSPGVDSMWHCRYCIYDFLILFIESPSTDLTYSFGFLDQSFVAAVVARFSSAPLIELERLQRCLHVIYNRFIRHRSLIRERIAHILSSLCYFQDDDCTGVEELLGLFGSIINGYLTPLKTEHVDYLFNYIMPLHRHAKMTSFSEPLKYCVVEYVRKDACLSSKVLRGIIKFWPRSDTHKELIMLEEVDEILALTDLKEFKLVSRDLLTRLSKCVCSLHCQVAERTLLFWHNDYFVSLMREEADLSIKVFFSAFERLRTHWNSTVRILSIFSLKQLIQFNDVLYDKLYSEYETCHLKISNI